MTAFQRLFEALSLVNRIEEVGGRIIQVCLLSGDSTASILVSANDESEWDQLMDRLEIPSWSITDSTGPDEPTFAKVTVQNPLTKSTLEVTSNWRVR